MDDQIRGLSSMATKTLLAELSGAWRGRGARSVSFESAGGVEVARNIRAGVEADLVVLGAEAMAALAADGLLVPETLRALFVSDVVAAVPAAADPLPFSTEEDLREVLIDPAQSGRIAYSTGPSGQAILELITRWELGDAVEQRMVQAPPGVPIGSLLAGGDADLGFQQRSELTGLAGVRVLGPLPGAAAIRSTFSGAVLARSANSTSAREVLEFLGSKDADAIVAAAGLTRPTAMGGGGDRHE